MSQVKSLISKSDQKWLTDMLTNDNGSKEPVIRCLVGNDLSKVWHKNIFPESSKREFMFFRVPFMIDFCIDSNSKNNLSV